RPPCPRPPRQRRGLAGARPLADAGRPALVQHGHLARGDRAAPRRPPRPGAGGVGLASLPSTPRRPPSETPEHRAQCRAARPPRGGVRAASEHATGGTVPVVVAHVPARRAGLAGTRARLGASATDPRPTPFARRL